MAKFLTGLENIFFSKTIYKDNIGEGLLNGNMYVICSQDINNVNKIITSLMKTCDRHFVVNKTTRFYLPIRYQGKIKNLNINKTSNRNEIYETLKKENDILKVFPMVIPNDNRNIFTSTMELERLIIDKINPVNEEHEMEILNFVINSLGMNAEGYKNKKLIFDLSFEMNHINSLGEITRNTYRQRKDLLYLVLWLMKYNLDKALDLFKGYTLMFISNNGLVKLDIDKTKYNLDTGKYQSNSIMPRLFRHFRVLTTGMIEINGQEVSVDADDEINDIVNKEIEMTKTEMEIINGTDDETLSDSTSTGMIDTYVKSVVNEKDIDKASATNKVIQDIKTNMKDKGYKPSPKELKYISKIDDLGINTKEGIVTGVVGATTGSKAVITETFNKNTESLQENDTAPHLNLDIKRNSYHNADALYEKNVKSYDLKRSMKSLSVNKAIPLYVQDIKVKDKSDYLNYIDEWKFTMKDKDGVQSTINLHIPKLIDDTFLYIGGNKKILFKQITANPIAKIDNDVIITTDYNKIFVTLKGGKYVTPTEGKVISGLSKLQKKGDDLNGILTFGDVYNSNLSYGLGCNDYNNISKVITKLKSDNIEISFNLNKILADRIDKKIPGLIQIGMFKDIPLEMDTHSGELVFENARYTFIDGLIKLIELDPSMSGIKEELEAAIYDDIVDYEKLNTSQFINIVSEKELEGLKDIVGESSNTLNATSATHVKMMGRWIPMIYVLSYTNGLYTTLERAKIKYDLSYKINLKDDVDGKKRCKYDKQKQICLECKDGFIVIDLNSETNAALVTPLKKLDLTMFNISDLEKKAYIAVLIETLYGSNNLPAYIDSFAENLLYPKIQADLESLQMPSDFLGVFLYSNDLLLNGVSYSDNDLSQKRIRGAEVVHAVAYESVAEAYAEYVIKKKRGNVTSKFTMNPNVVVQKLHDLMSMEDFSTVNVISEEMKKSAAQMKGHKGVNLDRAYGIDKRVYDKSFYGVFGMATPYGPGAGVTKHLVLDPNITNLNGNIKITNSDEEIEKLPLRKLLTPAEAITPGSLNHDDAARVLMNSGQVTQALNVNGASPMRLSYGYDEMLPNLTADFVIKAKQDGVIHAMDNNSIVIKYKDGTYEAQPLFVLERNSAKSFYMSNNMVKVPGLKVGSKVKKDDKLAYNDKCFKYVGGELVYTMTPMVYVALMSGPGLYEDSTMISQTFSKLSSTPIIKRYVVRMDKSSIINTCASVGDKVNASNILLSFNRASEDDYLNRFLGSSLDDDSINTIKKKSKKSGMVYDIKVYYSCEKNNMSASILKTINDLDRRATIQEKNVHIYGSDLDKLIRTSVSKYVTAGSKVGGFKISEDEVVFEIFVESNDVTSIGDKVSYHSAVKGITSMVLDDDQMPVGVKSNKRVDCALWALSIGARKIYSIHMTGAINKAMIKVSEDMQEMLKKGKKIDDILSYMLSIIAKIDKAGPSVRIYTDRFKSMTPANKIRFIEDGVCRVYIDDLYTEPKLVDCLKVCEELGVPVMEKITLPLMNEDGEVSDDHMISDKEVMVVPISVKRLYQMVDKETSISSDNTVRDKTNQVMGESKSAMISDLEVIAGILNGHESIIQEMFTVRADYTVSKDEFYSEIMEKGEVEDLPASINDPANKQALKVLFWHYFGMWIETDMMYDFENEI